MSFAVCFVCRLVADGAVGLDFFAGFSDFLHDFVELVVVGGDGKFLGEEADGDVGDAADFSDSGFHKGCAVGTVEVFDLVGFFHVCVHLVLYVCWVYRVIMEKVTRR